MGNKKLPKDMEDFFPLSNIQEAMVRYSVLGPAGSLYHHCVLFQFEFRDFDEKIFNNVLNLMVEKHPMLRTGFNMYDFEKPIQIVRKSINPDVQHHDISSLAPPARQEYVKKLILEDRQESFNVTNAEPLWRIKTVSPGNDKLYILWSCHHAVMDGWSFSSLLVEVESTYARINQDPGFIPGKLKNSYKKYVIEELREKKKRQNIDFWRKELQGYKRIDFSKISLNKNKKNGISKTVIVSKYLGDDLAGKLEHAAKKYNTCLKHLCFGAYVYMVNMLSSDNDAVVGNIIHSRPVCPDGDKIIGCFLNTVPVRVKIPPRLKWSDYILSIENKLLELKPYERLPFLEIAKTVSDVTQKRNPLFDTVFNYTDFHISNRLNIKNAPVDRPRSDGYTVSVEEPGSTSELYDFGVTSKLDVSTTNGEFTALFVFSNTRIGAEGGVTLCSYFEKILHKFVEVPGSAVNKEELTSNRSSHSI